MDIYLGIYIIHCDEGLQNSHNKQLPKLLVTCDDWNTPSILITQVHWNQSSLNYKSTEKNPAYRRHWISWLVWIVATIKIKINILLHVSGVHCQVSGVRYHASHVTCHMSLTPTATVTDPPLLTPPVCTAGCCSSSWPRPKY